MVKYCLIFVLVCVLSAVAVSATAPGSVYAGSYYLFQIRAGAGGKSIADRVDQVTTRVNDLLGLDEFEPSDLTVVQIKVKSDSSPASGIDETCICYRADLIVTVDRATARVNGATTTQLALKWVAAMRSVIPRAKASTPDK